MNTNELIKKFREVCDLQEKRIKDRDETIERLNRNNDLLTEMSNTAIEALSELYKITSTYHRKILDGEATVEDVKECSNIVQRSLKYTREHHRLQQTYLKTCLLKPTEIKEPNIV